MTINIPANPLETGTDELERFALEECVKRQRVDHSVSILIVSDKRCEMAIKFAHLGAHVIVADDPGLQHDVEGRILASGLRDDISFTPCHLSSLPEELPGEPFDMIIIRRGLCTMPYDEARQIFNQMLQGFPDNPDVVYPVALLALQQNDLAVAEAQFKHLLTLSIPDKSLAYYYLAQIAEEKGKTDEAIDLYAKVESGDQLVQARMRGAQLLAGQGKLDEARKLLSEANAVSAEQSLQLAIAEAALLRKAKQPQAAFDLLDALLEKQPDNPELLYETALLAERLDQMAIMERRLRRLIELQPENGQAYNALGYSFADRGIQLTEARELIEKALALMPNDTFILDSLGWVLYRQGDLPGGLAALERAYGMRDDPEIAAHLGEVLWSMNRKDEAQKLLRAAQKKHPDNEPLADAVKKFAD